MSHSTIRRLSVVGCLALCLGLLVLAFRTPEPVKVAKISVPPPRVMATSPDPEPDPVTPPPRMSPRPSPAAKPGKHGAKAAGSDAPADPVKAVDEEALKKVMEDFAAANKSGAIRIRNLGGAAPEPTRMLGITPSAISEDEGRLLGLLSDQGAIRVDAVIPDSVAAGIGLQAGDIVTSLDGYSLPRGREVETLKSTMSGIGSKRPAALTVYRDGRSMTLFPSWD